MPEIRMFRIVLRPLLAAAVSLAPVGIRAEDRTCAARPAILALSDAVLAHRKSLPRAEARQYGAEAAYLKLRYMPLAGEAALLFLTELLAADIGDLPELSIAWALAEFGLDQASADLGEDAVVALGLAGATGIRALILAGAEDVVVDALSAEPEQARPARLHPIYTALVDQPDELKQRVADRAESRGHLALAGALHATRRDPTAWADFAARLADGALAADLAHRFRTLPAAVGNPPLAGTTHLDPVTWAKLHDIAVAAALQPEREFLSEFLNVSGLLDETHAAAAALQAAIADGALAPKAPRDAGWLLVYGELRSRIADKALLENFLRIPMSDRHLRASVAEILEWSFAAAALGPYVAGELAEPPPAPEGPAGILAGDWPRWLEIAELLRNDPRAAALPADAAGLTIAAELLFAAKRPDDLAALLGNAAPSPASTANAADFARRLDRLCAAYLWHRAEALLLRGLPIYKFEDGRPERRPDLPG